MIEQVAARSEHELARQLPETQAVQVFGSGDQDRFVRPYERFASGFLLGIGWRTPRPRVAERAHFSARKRVWNS